MQTEKIITYILNQNIIVFVKGNKKVYKVADFVKAKK